MRPFRTLLVRAPFLLSLSMVLTTCGQDPHLAQTVGLVERVRGQVAVQDEPLEVRARTLASDRVEVGPEGLARISLDGGAVLLADAGARFVFVDERTAALEVGRIYGDAGSAEELVIESGDGLRVRASDAAISAEARDGGLEVYAIRGSVSYQLGDRERGIVGAGRRLVVENGQARMEPVRLWTDWTGGLAQVGPGDATGAAGVGTLEARVPEEVGQARWPLVARRLDVRVSIVGDFAVTEVEQQFFNPASEAVEGLYRLRVPSDAILSRFAVDRNGHLVDGYVREQAQARRAYEAQVYRGSTLDPALLEWVAPGRYQARIYPIAAGATRRVVVRYSQWLEPGRSGRPRLYQLPMGAGRDAPLVQELSVVVDVEQAHASRVRAGLGASIVEGQVRLRRSDFVPRSDFWLELYGQDPGQRTYVAPHEPPPRAPDARQVVGEADERDYWYLPLRVPSDLLAQTRDAQGVDLVVVADVSAGTERSHLELGRAVVEALAAHLTERDRITVVTSDIALRQAADQDEPTALAAATPARTEALLRGLSQARAAGATDLGRILEQASSHLTSDRLGALVYVGDGAPTVGELEASGLLTRLARLPQRPRLYAVGVGSDANLDLLEALTRGGGLTQSVAERSAAADAALSILAHLNRPILAGATVEIGDGIDNVYPRRPVDAVLGDVLEVVGRVRGDLPERVVLRGTLFGEPVEREIPIVVHPVGELAPTDLRLRWANQRLGQLLLAGASREEIAELGTRYGLITPFTSFYVPSQAELGALGPYGARWIDRPELLTGSTTQAGWGDALAMLLLGPLALSGCGSEDRAVGGGDPAPAEPTPTSIPSATAEVELADETLPEGDETGTVALRRSAGDYATDGSEEVPAAQPESEAPAAPPVVIGASGGLALNSPGVERAARRRGRADIGPAATAAQEQALSAGDREQLNHLGYVGSGGTRASGSSGADLSSAMEARRGPSSSNRATIRPRPATGQQGQFELDAEEDADAFESGITVRVTERRRLRPGAHRRAHRRVRCSDAATVPLEDRTSLWEERLAQAGGPAAWVAIYRLAIRACEAPTWRDRRTLLSAILRRAGSIAAMVAVYRLLSSGSARSYLRLAIRRRVRSPEDLRAVRGAFGSGSEPDWVLVEQILSRAQTPRARVRALRRLAYQYPESLDLRLRLLAAFEVAEARAEALRLADELRIDPRADAGVRTAIGEMLIRFGSEAEARRVFSEIVEFAPFDELARRRLGDLYRAYGWYEDAYRQYQTLIEIRPDDPGALLLLAQAAAGAGRLDEALRLERRVMQTAEPAASGGLAQIATLWSSVRLAKLRYAAREDGNRERLAALARRVRRSGVLRAAGDLRVTLTWSHPDAQLSLWAGHPGESIVRANTLYPEYGLEAFDVREMEEARYPIEVRRADPESPTELRAELVLVYHEGQVDEVVRVAELTFAEGTDRATFVIEGGEWQRP